MADDSKKNKGKWEKDDLEVVKIVYKGKVVKPKDKDKKDKK